MKIALVLCSDSHEPGKDCISSATKVLKSHGFEVIVGDSFNSFSSDTRLSSASLIVAGPFCDVSVLSAIREASPTVKWMHSWIAGLDTYRDFLKEEVNSELAVTNARGAYSAPLAEWLIFACCYFEKSVQRLFDMKTAATWDRFRMGELRGKTIGFVGWGHIAQTCARVCRVFGMKVLALRRHAYADSTGLCDEVVPSEKKMDLFRRSDFVVCVLPGGEATYHYCGTSEFTAMKPTGVFISMGRGSCVDESALVEVLKSKCIRGAALDVFEKEPLPSSSPLWNLDNILLSAHNADWTHEYEQCASKVFEDNLKSFVTGGPWATPINKELGY